MTAVTVFLADVGVTSGVSLIVVAYLRRPLRAILADLCGTAERAKFWSAFSNVTLVLVADFRHAVPARTGARHNGGT